MADIDPIHADYFDGRSARAHAVQLQREGEMLRIEGEALSRQVALADIAWPERTRHGARVAQLPDGASLQGHDARRWDAFAAACERRDAWVVRAQQSWRGVLASAVLLVLVLGATYLWGLPWAARGVVALTPIEVDADIGAAVFESLEAQQLLQASELSEADQEALRTAFERALAAQPPGTVPSHRIVFRRSMRLGPNAFALPGGTIVVTDQLVKLVGDATPQLVGVLAHELGHVRQRHGMRLLLQASAIGVLAGAVLGDFSSVLAGAPVVLGHAAYSRDAEREADAESVRVLKDAHLSPAVMAEFFDKLAAQAGHSGDGGSWLGIAIGSHPADAERIAFFRDAAAR